MKGFFDASLLGAKAAISQIPACGACGLYKHCRSPKMPVTGKGQRKILILGEAPGETEDERNQQFIGKAGQRLEREFRAVGIDMRRDCWLTNSLICWPGSGNPTPDPKQIEYCRPNLFNTLGALQPDVILCFGMTAVRSLIGHVWKKDVGQISRWVGYRIPNQKPNAWLCPMYHPSYLERMNDPVLDLHFHRHLKKAVALEGKPWEELPEYEKQVQVIINPEEASAKLKQFIAKRPTLIAFDYETNMLKPDSEEAQIATCSVSDSETTLAYVWHGEAIELTRQLLMDKKIGKVASNCFSGDTKFVTQEYGIVSLAEMEGKSVTVLNHHGKWVSAKIKSFGKQETVEVTFGRRNHLVTVRATDDHRWILKSSEERKTKHLRKHEWKWKADKVPYLTAPKNPLDRKEYLKGIRHGIVLGDGSRCWNNGGKRHRKLSKDRFEVRLCGPKKELVQYFKAIDCRVAYYPCYEGDPLVVLYHQELDLKKPPPPSVSDSYLIGFFRGLLATDGSVNHAGQIHVTNSKEVIDWCVQNLPRVGYWFQCKVHENDYTDGTLDENGFRLVQDTWSVYLSRESIQIEDLLRSKHQKNYKSVDMGPFKFHSFGKRRKEKVYCAIVSEGESFTLEGGLVTGNCKFEQRWTIKEFGTGVKGWVWDTMQAAHILDNRKAAITGLKFQAYVHLGAEAYDGGVSQFLENPNSNKPNKIKQCDLKRLLLYNGMDSLLEVLLAPIQMRQAKFVL